MHAHWDAVDGKGRDVKRIVLLTLATFLAMSVYTVPASSGGEPQGPGGLFWVKCTVTRRENFIDPITAYGVKSAHQHVIFGSKVRRTSTPDTLRRKAFTNCSAPTDFSGYWIPTFYDSQGHLMTPDDIVVYYAALGDRTRVPFPQDFARVSEQVVYTCGRGTHRSLEFRPCPAPTSPRMIVIFQPGPGDPNFPETRLGIRWTSQVGADPSTWTASSDPKAMHGDFMNGWIRKDLRMLIDRCLNDPKVQGCGKITKKDF
jgi:hypothetical protein